MQPLSYRRLAAVILVWLFMRFPPLIGGAEEVSRPEEVSNVDLWNISR